MTEKLRNLETNELGETIAAQALEIHSETKETITSSLGIDQQTAERETGEYFIDKIESDLEEGTSQETLVADVGAALISGSTQIETSGNVHEELTEEVLVDNPITELEQTHPEFVTAAVIELSKEKKTSKFAEIVTLTADALRTIGNKIALRAVERKAAHPIEASFEISLEEAAKRLEREGTVKQAPRFSEQQQDATRTNEIVYISGAEKDIGSATSTEEFRGKRSSTTEHDALQELDDFLEKIVESKSGRYSKTAAEMRESLTYIGEKEYNEAAAGIAAYWKAELDKNDSLTIFAVTGLIAKGIQKYTDSEGVQQVKSDDFLLERILSNFSDEELEKYGDRLIVDYDDETDKKVIDLKVVLLDDWAVSGLQLRAARTIFTEVYPHRAKSVEVQLVAASEKRIKKGLMAPTKKGTFESIPLRAYYTAHESESGNFSGAHVTGFHSSVDYDFEKSIADMVKSRREVFREDVTMPSLTNIVRPYRYDGINRSNFFIHRERLAAQSKNLPI